MIEAAHRLPGPTGVGPVATTMPDDFQRSGPTTRRSGRRRRARGAAVPTVIFLGVAGVAGCSTNGLFGSAAPSSNGGAATPGAATPGAATPGAATPASSAPSQALPALIGKGLQYAVDQARSAGFTDLVTHDVSGRVRTQLLFRDWKVCFQNPPAGVHPTSVRVDFGVVKLAETCPPADQGLPTLTAGALMPDLRRRSARFAAEVLGSNASISYKKPSGGDALVLVDSNWQVCDQSPAPGQPYAGVPVTLTVVKYSDGGCPAATT